MAVALSFLFALPLRAQTCTVHEKQKLIASDASASDRLGSSVSVSGNRAITGAWGVASSGAAYIFRLDDNGTPMHAIDDFWVEEQELTPSNPSGGDLFGWSVSVHKTRAIVGARFHRTPIRSGAAYVFRLDDNGTPEDPADDIWLEQQKLTASDTSAGDFFGRVAISGDFVIAGSLNDDAGESAGALYVFSATTVCYSQMDYVQFHDCITGVDGGILADCLVFDSDGDSDIDLSDFSLFLTTVVGP